MSSQLSIQLCDEFRTRYWTLVDRISSAIQQHDDANNLTRLGDQLDDFIRLFEQHRSVFPNEERETLCQNLSRMRTDIQLQYQDSTEHVIEHIHTGRKGRPWVWIDPEFLRDAYQITSAQRIAAFLGVGRTVVRSHLLELGLAEPKENPFTGNPSGIISYARRVSNVNDEELDGPVRNVLEQHHHQGVAMLRRTLSSMGYVISEWQVRQSLRRLQPGRLSACAPVTRRSYTVPGPNALWHHNGQHGLIRWGIVPMRLQGDHGIENLLIAAWMEQFRGTEQGAYIWGRSVHNIRIERLWVDVTMQVGSKWAAGFRRLEQDGGLSIENPNHIWLLHQLFLPVANSDLDAFVNAWNHHTMRIRGGPNRTPLDMFFFDMVALGERGDVLPESISSPVESDTGIFARFPR
ncbi:hypothetical protein ACEPAF_1126 [Sanghuangporus sanghuang]